MLVEGESSKESCLSEVPSRRSFQNREMFDISKFYCARMFNVVLMCMCLC